MAGPAPGVAQALALLREGRRDEAGRVLAQCLRADPDDAAALHLHGLLLLEGGEAAPALAAIERALSLQPDNPGLHLQRGNALATLGRQADALACFRQALDAAPALVAAQLGRARAAFALGEDAEAAAAYAQWLLHDPRDAEAWNRRGIALHRLGELDVAQHCFERVVALAPAHAPGWNNLGNLRYDRIQPQAALEDFERALAIAPDFPEAVANRALALQALGRLDEARADYDRALALRPGYREALRRRGALSLLQGELRAGWADYDSGHAEAEQARAGPGAPRFWQGEDLRGKSLLLSEPNGLGDTLQFFRFVPRLLERGARLAFTGPPALFRLLAPFADRVEFIADARGRRFDYQCWLWSLPHHLGIVRMDELAQGVPWLRAEPALAAAWRARLDPAAFNIGICWQGNPRRKIDHARSIPLRAFAPLASLPGVRLVSLQKGHGLDQLAALPAGMPIQVLDGFDEGPDAFVDTAAVLEGLDLVVSADTSLTHVAGAMGRPAWLALNPVPDWRWLLGREDSPWYPSVRLFRQADYGHWEPVFEAMAQALGPRLGAAR